VATTGLSIGWMLFHDQVDDPAELRSAVLGIAFELAGGPAEAADQPEESGPGPAWPPAAARTSGSTR
jgi:hypothetical protein